MELTIRTDSKWKQFKYRNEVPANILASEFDYQLERRYDENDEPVMVETDDTPADGFFCYRGNWYHLDQFTRIDQNAPEPMQKWHGYASDSFFSGIVIKVSGDGEEYMVGMYMS